MPQSAPVRAGPHYTPPWVDRASGTVPLSPRGGPQAGRVPLIGQEADSGTGEVLRPAIGRTGPRRQRRLARQQPHSGRRLVGAAGQTGAGLYASPSSQELAFTNSPPENGPYSLRGYRASHEDQWSTSASGGPVNKLFVRPGVRARRSCSSVGLAWRDCSPALGSLPRAPWEVMAASSRYGTPGMRSSRRDGQCGARRRTGDRRRERLASKSR